jgi:hypothetical protein
MVDYHIGIVFETPMTIPKRMKIEVALTPVEPSAITAARKTRIATTTNSSSGTTVVFYTGGQASLIVEHVVGKVDQVVYIIERHLW